mgnify:CR=1 FL=1
MPRGQMTRYEVLSKVYKLKNELDGENCSSIHKQIANKYLDELLLYLNSFSY